MSDLSAFSLGGATTVLSPTTNSNGDAIAPVNGRIRVYNAGGSLAFLRTGIGAQTAETTDTPIPPGVVEVFSVPANHTHAAAICASGSATIYITAGKGQ
jgi:hypothetical protein